MARRNAGVLHEVKKLSGRSVDLLRLVFNSGEDGFVVGMRFESASVELQDLGLIQWLDMNVYSITDLGYDACRELGIDDGCRTDPKS